MKKQITITIDPELVEWIEKKVTEKTFANVSHGVEYAIQQQINKEKNENKK